FCSDMFGKTVDLAQAEAQSDLCFGFVPKSLERAIPVRMIDVGRQYLDSVLGGVADDLRGGIESHRLRIEQRGRERRRVTAFQPARNIDQVREAGRVAFGKAVFAKALDLIKAALGEIGIVP